MKQILLLLVLSSVLVGQSTVNVVPGTVASGGSNATTVNGAAVPASQSCLGSNSSSQLIGCTITNLLTSANVWTNSNYFEGGFGTTTKTITANYSSSSSDSTIVLNCSSACTVTLTGTGLTQGYQMNLVNIQNVTDTITATAAGGIHLQGSTAPTNSVSLPPYTSLNIQYDGSAYREILGVLPSTLALLASPTFTGTPAAPTATSGTNTTQLATTAFVQTAVAGFAPLASPTFTGTPAVPTASTGTNTTQAASTAFVQSSLPVAAPPYMKQGSNYYIPADNFYQATIPSLGSWTAMSTQTGTLATQTNGDVTYNVTTNTAAFLAAPSQVNSIEIVFNFTVASSNFNYPSGLYFYDSTNSKCQVLALYPTGTSAASIEALVYTYSGTGNPTYSSTTALIGSSGTSLLHLKGAVSGTTLTFSISTDGGVNYNTLTTVTVGTISKMGIVNEFGKMDLFSVLVS